MEKRKSSFRKLDILVTSRGVTYYKLAKDLGFSNVVFTNWKTGRSMPKLDKLLKIANYFNVPVEYFLVDSDGKGVE